MTITIIVPAAGCGARAGLNGNKILAPLGSKPLLWWTLRALTHPDSIPPGSKLAEVIVAGRPEEFSALQECAPHGDFRFHLVEGGDTRQASVHNAVRAAAGNILMVHDAARPLVSSALVQRVAATALEHGAAIAALPVADTVKVVDSFVITETLDRRTIWLAQTPQAFRRDLMLSAFEAAERDGFEGTDCASLIERLHPVRVVEGETGNFKVTFAEDVRRAVEIIGIHLDR